MSKNNQLIIRILLKFFTLFLILGSLIAQSFLNRRIELKKDSYTIQEVIKELQEEHEISISFGDLPENKKVQFDSNTQTVQEVLDAILKKSSYTYQVVGSKILIIKKSELKKQSGKATIRGYIKDKKTGEALIGATIYDANSQSGVVTNTYGFYSLTLPKGDVALNVAYLGFKEESLSIDLNSDINHDFILEEHADLLDEVTVEAFAYEQIELSPQMSTISLTAKQLENVPMILGERDIMKAIQLLPGIQSGVEGSSGIYVRGGGPDQNLILLDGVPVYNTGHLFGFFSIFEGDAINSVEVIKGGFPARYGGRLSSVVDISMKEGNNKKLTGKGTIGLISSKFLLEGPIKNENTSFIISGRRTYLDLLAIPGDIDEKNDYYFYDLSAKINHRFSEKDRIFLSVYGGKDDFTQITESNVFRDDEIITNTANANIDWGNLISILRWNHVFNPKLFGTFSAHYSRFQFNSQDERFSPRSVNAESLEYVSGIKDYAFRASLDYQLNPKYNIGFGATAIAHQFNTGVIELTSENNSNPDNPRQKIDAQEYSAYVENVFSLGKRLRINAGLHASSFHVDDVNYYSLQPRFSGRVLLENKYAIKVSYSEMRQFIHLLTNSGVGLPTDLWVPSTKNVDPQFSRQLALGLAKSYDQYELSLEGYYKEMDNLIEYENGASYMNTDTSWEDKIEFGNGESRGLEFLVRKNTGRLTGWIGYTLSESTRQFDDLNFGETFNYKYDRRHDIAITAHYQLGKNWEVASNWVYGTGNRISLPTSRHINPTRGFTYTDENGGSYFFIADHYRNPVENFDERNNYQMQSYHRMDISFSNSKTKKHGVRTWSFGVYNAYNRSNPFYVYVEGDYNHYITPTLKQTTLFPAIPFVNYSFKF